MIKIKYKFQMNLTSDSKSITKFKNIKKQLLIVWVGVNI